MTGLTATTTLGFTNSLQQLIWTKGTNIPVTAYLWGGGGGGGGADAFPGGAGSGGGFTQVDFTVSENDIIEVAVGAGGGAGQTTPGVGGSPGGTAGASYSSRSIFDTRTASTAPPVIPSSNSAYVSFLNQYGVWANPVSVRDFDRFYTVNFPVTGNYTFTASCDDFGTIFLDGVPILDVPGFRTTYSTTIEVSAGLKILRIIGVNTGGPGAVALTINGGIVPSGGRGGFAGFSGWSGGGGGGGGATVLLKNNTVIGIAGGGGGGGGGGRASAGQNAPGASGFTSVPTGATGTDKSGDGGGGGGGGGGANGGRGGGNTSGDVGGLAGFYGSGGEPPIGRLPGGTSSIYYTGAVAQGGAPGSAGNSGAAVFNFIIPGVYINGGSSFEPVKNIFVRSNNQWIPVRRTFIRQNNIWIPVDGSFAPNFSRITGNFGAVPAPAPMAPVAPAPDPGDGGGWDPGDGGGDGGSKIICTKLYELGLMHKDVYEADQAYGAIVAEKDPALINGYHYWANIVVEWMSGGGIQVIPFISKDTHNKLAAKWATAWAKEIATPWAEHMQYKMGGRTEDSRLGRVLMTVGAPLSRLFANKKTKPSTLTALGCVATFTVLYALVKITKLIKK